jgi:hypothetical protein
MEKQMQVKVGCRTVLASPAAGSTIARLTGKPRAMGCNVYEKNLIYWKRGMPESVRAVTLLHELLHDLDSSYSLRLGEQTVDTLATALVTMLRDNKGLSALLDGRKAIPE